LDKPQRRAFSSDCTLSISIIRIYGQEKKAPS
jgi:hypothetical protein